MTLTTGGNPDTFMDLLKKHASAPDKAVLKQSEFRGILFKSCKEAFANSSLGFYQDLLIYANPWGFELGARLKITWAFDGRYRR